MADFVERIPTADEVRSLAQSVGWDDHYDWDTIPAALNGSLHAVVVLDQHGVQGAGRLVGDGIRYLYVQDVIVRPSASDDGLAMQIVERLLAWVKQRAGASAVVGLFSSPYGVYSELGFAPATKDPVGMTSDVTG